LDIDNVLFSVIVKLVLLSCCILLVNNVLRTSTIENLRECTENAITNVFLQYYCRPVFYSWWLAFAMPSCKYLYYAWSHTVIGSNWLYEHVHYNYYLTDNIDILQPEIGGLLYQCMTIYCSGSVVSIGSFDCLCQYWIS
jgi:hypothetical protein